MSELRRFGGEGQRRGSRVSGGVILIKPWTLISQSNLVLALDARLGVAIDTGVNPWSDQSAQENDFSQATTSKQPAYVTVGGRPALDFDGVDDSLDIAGSFSGIGAGSDLTVFCVALCDVIASSNNILELSDQDPSTVNTGVMFYRDVGNSRLVRIAQAPATRHDVTDTTIASTTDPEIWEMTHEDTATNAWIDGVLLGTDTAPTITIDAQISGRIGDSDGLPGLNGKVFSVLVYNTILSAGDRTTVRNALANVWGVSL